MKLRNSKDGHDKGGYDEKCHHEERPIVLRTGSFRAPELKVVKEVPGLSMVICCKLDLFIYGLPVFDKKLDMLM